MGGSVQKFATDYGLFSLHTKDLSSCICDPRVSLRERLHGVGLNGCVLYSYNTDSHLGMGIETRFL